jgi:hypothetical protein
MGKARLAEGVTVVYSAIDSAPACPGSYAAEVASLKTPLRVGTSCKLQPLHVLATGVPGERRRSSGFRDSPHTAAANRLSPRNQIWCTAFGFNPIEELFAKLRSFLRNTKARTVDRLARGSRSFFP